MTTQEAIYGRRAIRDYLPEPVSDETITELIDAAIQAPNAINLQPWAFSVVQDRDLLSEISARALEILKEQPLPPELRAMIDAPGWNIFYNAGTLIVICARPIGERADWDCCLAGENMMLAARDRGLGSCVIGFARPALDLPDIRTKLRIPEEYQVILPIILGYAKQFPHSPGRRAPELLSWLAPVNA